MSSAPWLVVGLGNPGPQYAGNRHNIGHMAINRAAERAGAKLSSHKAGALVARIRLGGPGVDAPDVLWARTTSFMNGSGRPVAGLLQYFSVPIEQLIVIHDELDIALGAVRCKQGGGEGGHNGLRDISRAVGTKDYLRVRLGVGRPPGRMDPAAYVLRDFAPSERTERDLLVEVGLDAAESLIVHGLNQTQQAFHSRTV